MAVILFAWELGGGMGHIMRIKPLVEDLLANGHRVFLALRDLSSAHVAFGGLGALLLQAPSLHGYRSPPYPAPCTYPQIIADAGFGDDCLLGNHAVAWRNLYRCVRPDLIVSDHSPTAVLAARGLPAKLVLIGTGFIVPPDSCPYPDLREPPQIAVEELHKQEAQIVQRINGVLRAWRQRPLERLSELFSQVAERILATFEELDHYRGRPTTRYWGSVTASGGKMPQWPAGPGPKVFAYLKNFPALKGLLGFLKDRAIPSLVVGDGIAPRIEQEFSAPTLRFERQRLDPDEAARQCDVGIINGTHGSAASMMLAGKPTLNLPLFLEQSIMGRNIREYGAGLDASPAKWEPAREKLEALFCDERYRAGAQRFAAKYRGFDPHQQRSEMLARMLQLL